MPLHKVCFDCMRAMETGFEVLPPREMCFEEMGAVGKGV